MNIWIVNPFDPLPGEAFRAGRYAFIAETLVRNGHRVVWWTSSWFHYSKSYRSADDFKQRDDFKVIYIPTPPYRNNIGMARLYNHFKYGAEFRRLAIQDTNSPDIILASFPPIGTATAAITVARKHRCKVVVDIQDLWPEVFLLAFPVNLRPIANILFTPFYWQVRGIMNRADAIMAVSLDYLQAGQRRCETEKPGLSLHLGIDLASFDKRKNSEPLSPIIQKRPGVKWIIYIGTMGKTYDLDAIIKSACYLKNKNEIKFIFAGAGPELQRIKEIAKSENLGNVCFTGFLKADELNDLLIKCDIGLNTFAPDAPQSFPNKVFDYLAAGLPVINSISGELREILTQRNAGLWYQSGNPESLVKAIDILLNDDEKRKKMAGNARRLVEEHYDRNKTYPSIIPFFEKVLET